MHKKLTGLHAIFARDTLKHAAMIAALKPEDFASVHLVPLAELDTRLQTVVAELVAAGVIKEGTT